MADFKKDISMNAYRIDDLGDVKPKIVIGGKTQKFVPNLNISFDCASGKEKYFININRKSVIVGNETDSFSPQGISLSVGKQKDIWHVDEDGKFAWDIEFREKPTVNVFSWDLLHSEDLEFAYQPELTEEEIKKGTIRPDNVVGSYAVYCNKSGHFKRNGKTTVNYATGKLLHIYRPLCIDAMGEKCWAELLIEKGKLQITIPQKFLDSALYPVVLDPEFGYTSVGASSGSTSDGSVYFPLDQLSPATGGILTNVSIFQNNAWGTDSAFQFGFYSDNDGVPNTRLAYEASATTHGGAGENGLWKTSTPAWSYELASLTQYWASSHSSGWMMPGGIFRYDSGGSKSNRYRAADTTPPASAGSTSGDYDSAHFSAYATYEEGGGIEETNIPLLMAGYRFRRV